MAPWPRSSPIWTTSWTRTYIKKKKPEHDSRVVRVVQVNIVKSQLRSRDGTSSSTRQSSTLLPRKIHVLRMTRGLEYIYTHTCPAGSRKEVRGRAVCALWEPEYVSRAYDRHLLGTRERYIYVPAHRCNYKCIKAGRPRRAPGRFKRDRSWAHGPFKSRDGWTPAGSLATLGRPTLYCVYFRL